MWKSVKMWSKLYFQHHYSSLQCHMIFRNHNNMLICCSRNISDYYQCWKQLCCTIFLWKLWWILFFRIHRWIESSEEQHLFEIEIFCNIINVFTVTFDQFNESLLNKSINFLKDKKKKTDHKQTVCVYTVYIRVCVCVFVLLFAFDLIQVWFCMFQLECLKALVILYYYSTMAKIPCYFWYFLLLL